MRPRRTLRRLAALSLTRLAARVRLGEAVAELQYPEPSCLCLTDLGRCGEDARVHQAWRRILRATKIARFAALVGFLLACGGGAEHPDTGYGKGQAVPTTQNCSDLCARESDCAGHLCAEDKNSNAYLGAIGMLNAQCTAVCTSAVTSVITSAQWSCLFAKSCREVFGQNACNAPNA